jgi:hypothetical protein
MKRRTTLTGYGQSQPLINMQYPPIVANRAPTDQDWYDIGQIWIDKRPTQNIAWLLVSYNNGVTAGSPVWVRIDTNADNSLTYTRTPDNAINLEANAGYVLHTAGNKVLTLPEAAALGSVIEISTEGLGANSITFAQRAGQQITWGDVEPVAGVGHGLRLNANAIYRNSFKIVCSAANTGFVITNNDPGFALAAY